MARLYLVRHGKAAASWDSDLDPGLDDLGRAQANRMAADLAPKGPLPLIVSPLRRTRETASALERRWGNAARIEPRVSEIPSPAMALPQRIEWLRSVMKRRWHEAEPGLELWRQTVLQALSAIEQNSVVISHFVVINVAVGYARGDDRVTCFEPENCSCTVLDVSGAAFKLVELGVEAAARFILPGPG